MKEAEILLWDTGSLEDKKLNLKTLLISNKRFKLGSQVP